jgi:phosphonatase-like hydrolase
MKQGKRSVDLVVFDMAGTTVLDGTAVHDSLAGALKDVGECVVDYDAVNVVMGLQKPVAIRTLLQDQGISPTESLVEKIHDEFVSRMLQFYGHNPEVQEVKGVSTLFESLKANGIRVGIDTGFSREIAQVIIDRFRWEKNGLIDVSVTSDEVSAGRPAPYMIFRSMEKTGVQTVSRVAKIGDTPSDLYEGTNAGCGIVAGVTQGSHTADQMRSHPHTHLIGTVRDLPGILGIGSLPGKFAETGEPVAV